MDNSGADGTRGTNQRRYSKSCLPMGTMATNLSKRRRRYVAVLWAALGQAAACQIINVCAVIKAQWCVENLILDRGGCRFVGCYLDDDGSSGGAPKKIKTLCHSKRKRVRLWRLPGFDFDLLLISSASRAASDRAQPSSPHKGNRVRRRSWPRSQPNRSRSILLRHLPMRCFVYEIWSPEYSERESKSGHVFI